MSDDLEVASPQLGLAEGTIAAVHLDAARGSPPRRRASEDALPERLGRYIVLDRIGQGGMGVVVSAYDPELDRKLAIKLLRSDHATDEARARLVREAQAMAKLSHPSVVPVFDVGVVDEQVFVAMELVRGQTLAAWLREGPHPWPAVLERFVAAGEGLAAAHEAGIVHRDLKPANVLVSLAGRVQVTDFGLARALDEGPERSMIADLAREPSSLSQPLTRNDVLMGTPAYMAPELYRGQPADVRSDQFAFCVSLYEGLYGELPFRGRTLLDLATATARGHVDEPPGRGRQRVPPWLRKAVLRGLRPRPDERWPNMPALLATLAKDPRRARRRWLGLAALGTALGVGAWEHQARQASRCAGLEAELGGIWDAPRREEVAAALAAAGPTHARDTWPRVEAQLDAYAGEWSTVRAQACQAEARGDVSPAAHERQLGCLAERRRDLQGVVAVLAEADAGVAERSVHAVGSLPALTSCADPLALRAEVEPPADPETRATVDTLRGQLARARAEVSAAHYDAALSLADAVLLQAGALEYRPLVAEAQQQRGRALAGQGAYEAAAAALHAAWTAALASRHDALAAAAATEAIAVVGYHLARVDEGLAWADEAQAMLDRNGHDAQQAATHHYNLGTLYQRAGRYAEAAAALERAAALWSETLGPAHVLVATAYTALGDVLARQGRLEPSRAALLRAVAIQEAALGPEHPSVATARSNLGNVLGDAGQYAQAQAEHERALAIREASLGPAHSQVAASLTNLGVTLLMQGQLPQAEARFLRAIEIREAAQGASHPDLSDPVIDLGNVFFVQGREEQAEAQYRRALAIDLRALGADHPNVALTRANLGAALWRQRRWDEAERELQQAAADLERSLGSEHSSRAAVLHTLGEVALDRERPAQAREHLQAAQALAAATWPEPEQAKLRFGLARAAWALGEDRAAARTQAQAAAQALAEGGPLLRIEAARAAQWLHDHPLPPPLTP